MYPIERRTILRGVLTSPLLLTRAQAEVTPDAVRFGTEMDPLVKRIEQTPRERCAEMAVEQLNAGVSYRQFLAALFLAGIRNVNPRPPGFAMHCVFVVHSAHLLGMEAPPDARLLPLFYTLDDFKASQDRDARQTAGDYTMREWKGALPPASRAAAEFTAGMEAWDLERAERAAASLARHGSLNAVFELFWKYGARDYRNIGHKAIYPANAYRTLQTIGWRHAEPVLRSVTLGILDFSREQKVNGYALDDQCLHVNTKHVKDSFAAMEPALQNGVSEETAVKAIVKAIRESAPNEACSSVAEGMRKGRYSAASVWDAVHLAASELRMRSRGGASLASIHAVTSANGLHYGFQAAQDPHTRLFLLLQSVGWMGQFRAAANPANLRDCDITTVEAEASQDKPVEETFAEMRTNADRASRLLLGVARDNTSRQSFLNTALRHTVAKVSEVHYYKYLAALIEDAPQVSARWQPHVWAAAAYYVKGPGDGEPAWAKRAREALHGLKG
ncbi:MAG: hypothetical protein HY820_42735 [Acidobacteria bacterium]|nr:hypothetical protein [Acidobacteriota bacterium]